MNYWKSALD